MTTVALLCLAAILVSACVFIVVAYRRQWAWTGFTGSPGDGQERKTLWDWLQLLFIPVALVGVAFALNVAQSARDQRREDRRAELERSLALDQRRDDALSAYFRQMADVTQQSIGTRPDNNRARANRALARTLTLGVVRRLDGRRKGYVLHFLADSGLGAGRWPIDVAGADFRNTVIRGPLWNLSLAAADLRGADLRGAGLFGVNFRDADLRKANFSDVVARDVRFGYADLQGADFNEVDKGGHFAAWEEPELFSSELRAAFKSLR